MKNFVSRVLPAALLLSAFLTPACGSDDDDELVPGVEVGDQTANPANVVTIAAATLVGNGFVVIHEQNADGTLSSTTIGSSALLTAGRSLNIAITLSRNAVNGETLYAMLHSDTNGNGVYDDAATDEPVRDAVGEIITPSFVVSVDGGGQVGPSVTVNNQTLNQPDLVTISQAVYDQNGFVVIHEDNGGAPGDVLGNSVLLSPGTTNNISIQLNRNAIDGETLYAMLHKDNGDGIYTNPTDDPPVTDAGGNVVTPSFVVSLPQAPSAVTVKSQVADPVTRVVVRNVVNAKAGFIIIHFADENNNISANVLGASDYLTAGDYDNVVANLDGAVLNGQLLFAMLHEDTNGNQVYDGADIDKAVTDEKGLVIAPPFVAFLDDDTPFLLSLNQVAALPDVVNVLAAVSVGAGFVTLYEDDGSGGLGPLIGVSQAIVDGVNSDVRIITNRPVENGETLHARLHTDGDGNGVFNAGTDVPVLDGDNNQLISDFIVSLELTPSVTVQNQRIAPATEVTVDNVVVADNGFVVIHEQNEAGQIGDFFGSSVLLNAVPGIFNNVDITLDRSVAEGETLYAMLHSDNGDGVYTNPTDDPPVLDAGGNVISPPFVVTILNRVVVADQTAGGNNDQITIAESTYLDNGFVVIHEADGNGNVSPTIIGISDYLDPGSNFDLVIDLDREVVDGETLFAMLHEDSNGNQGYDGAVTDRPVEDDDELVIAPPLVVTRQ